MGRARQQTGGSVDIEQLLRALQDSLGAGYPVALGDLIHAWEVAGVEVAICTTASEREMRAAWRSRQGGGATPLLLVAAVETGVAVLGPGGQQDPIRVVPLEMLESALVRVESMDRRDAVVELAGELERIDTAGIPGIVVRGLLTRHLLEKRLRASGHWAELEERAKRVKAANSWRENLAALGWADSERTNQGYLYRVDGAPGLVVHPMRESADFGRLSVEGTLPEGALVSECRTTGAKWGLLATNDRYRLFRTDDGVGSSTGRYLEIDTSTTQHDDWPYIGLLHADSLKPGGLLEQLIDDAERFGVGLRERLEDRLRDEVMLLLSRGLGHAVASAGGELSNPGTLEEIEGAVLTLLFRLLFLLYCESQGYLPLESAAYRPHALTTLTRSALASRDKLDHRSTFYWDSFVVLVKAVRLGNRALGVPAYNGDLFAGDGLLGAGLLEQASMTDEVFGAALASLGFDSEGGGPEAGVDYAGLEVEHLGRIYENLLSLRLSAADVDLKVAKQKGKSGDIEVFVPAGPSDAVAVAAGELFFQTEEGGRKSGGVYYTRQEVVRHLTTHSVLPALHDHLDRVAAVADKDIAKAASMLFRFRVLDPAMGSAHFLADALDVVADEIQRFLALRPLPGVNDYLDGLRAHVETDLAGPVEDGALLRRLVLKHCIFGVDLSPMAVEVAKITLWLKSFVPGLALSYLNHNLRQGNSLVGVADDSCMVEDVGLSFLVGAYPEKRAETRALADRLAEVGDRTPDEVAESRALVAEIETVGAPVRQVFDLWTADPLGSLRTRALLQTELDAVVEGTPSLAASPYLTAAGELAAEHNFLHWPLAFPEVFAGDRPGFDAVIGNPPWEEVTIEELAFYALFQPGIRGLSAEADRRAAVEALKLRFPELPERFEHRRRELESLRAFFGRAGGYNLQAGGDTDLYQLFCERYTHLSRDGGRIGVVLPRSAFLVEGTRPFRKWLFTGSQVERVDFLLNKARWAFDMEPRYTFALLSAKRAKPVEGAVMSTTGPSDSAAEFRLASRSEGVRYPLSDFERWTRTGGEGSATWEVPLLKDQSSVDVFDKLRCGPRFDEGYKGVWHAFAVRELDETNDKKLFLHDEGLPVWKGRGFDQFDAHGAEPAGCAPEAELVKKLQGKRTNGRSAYVRYFAREYLQDEGTLDFKHARVAFRDVSRATDSRTVRAALVPPYTALTNTAPYLVFDVGGAREKAFVLGVMNSLAFDWGARRFVETHMNYFVLNMLTFPPAEAARVDDIAIRSARLSCVDERFADFAHEVGVDHGSMDDAERADVRAEIDALVAAAYGLSAADLEVVFGDFTVDAVPLSYRELARAKHSKFGGD